MTRRRVRPVPAPGPHFDAGEPPARDDRELDEFRVAYTSPEQDNPEVEQAVVSWLVGLLEKAGRR